MTSPLIKLCGLRTASDVRAALAAGADAVGFVLSPSPRRVRRSEAHALLGLVPPGVLRVAVLGAPTSEELSIANALEFDAVQCEVGSERPRLSPGRFLLPAFRDGRGVEAQVLSFLAEPRASTASGPYVGAFLLDGPAGGGRGLEPDADRAARLARTGRLLLAGGLTPENVSARAAACRPLGVDVSSGIERARGQKDPARMLAFADAARRPVPSLLDPDAPKVHP